MESLATGERLPWASFSWIQAVCGPSPVASWTGAFAWYGCQSDHVLPSGLLR